VEQKSKRSDLMRQRIRKGISGRGDGSDEEHEGGNEGMTLKFGKLKNIVEQHERAELDHDLGSSRGSQRQARDRDRTTGAKRSGQATRSMRLPLLILASHLENVLMDVWRKRIAPPFHYPVDSRDYPDYRIKVPQPISLNDIRNNIARGHYKTAKTFLSDLKLVAENAAIYNGASSQLAKDGFSLYKTALELIEVDRKLVSEFESDIKAKFSALGRSTREITGSAVPDVMNIPVTTTRPLQGGGKGGRTASKTPASLLTYNEPVSYRDPMKSSGSAVSALTGLGREGGPASSGSVSSAAAVGVGGVVPHEPDSQEVSDHDAEIIQADDGDNEDMDFVFGTDDDDMMMLDIEGGDENEAGGREGNIGAGEEMKLDEIVDDDPFLLIDVSGSSEGEEEVLEAG